LGGSQQRALDGDSNLNRAWNPNYREGMTGGVLTGMTYFGGPVEAGAILSTYDHSDFVAELLANNLPNLHETFNWKAANPSSSAPTGSMIESAVANYRYYGRTLSDYMGIYELLLNDTYGKNVTSGLNGGAGINGAGKIVSGAAQLPNPGALGMLKEFDSNDGNGSRSSLHYAYDGYRPHMTNQLCLIVGGFWPQGSAIANNAVNRLNVGNTDMWYKAEKGYIGYAKGKSQGVMSFTESGDTYGFIYNRSLWEDVLMPYHGLSEGAGDPEVEVGARVTTTAIAVLHAAASSSASEGVSLQAESPGNVIGGPVLEGEIEWWQVRFDSGFSGWVTREFIDLAPASDAYFAAGGGAWQNLPQQNLTGGFSISFNMQPSTSVVDSVVGLSFGPASEYSDLAVIVRMASSGVFDARNGGSYAAVNSLSYTPGTVYRVTLTVDLGARRYDATVTPPGAAPVVIAEDFNFRSEQSGVSSLDHLVIKADIGSQTVSGILLADGDPPKAASLQALEEGMRITYPTEPGRSYQLKISDQIDGNWSSLGSPLNTVGDPGPRLFDVIDTAALPRRFYRIEVSTP
ncbi:MAG: hypothetical protein AAGB14_01720, partial [Verrucomicrobiota bacterium]